MKTQGQKLLALSTLLKFSDQWVELLHWQESISIPPSMITDATDIIAAEALFAYFIRVAHQDEPFNFDKFIYIASTALLSFTSPIKNFLHFKEFVTYLQYAYQDQSSAETQVVSLLSFAIFFLPHTVVALLLKQGLKISDVDMRLVLLQDDPLLLALFTLHGVNWHLRFIQGDLPIETSITQERANTFEFLRTLSQIEQVSFKQGFLWLDSALEIKKYDFCKRILCYLISEAADNIDKRETLEVELIRLFKLHDIDESATLFQYAIDLGCLSGCDQKLKFYAALRVNTRDLWKQKQIATCNAASAMSTLLEYIRSAHECLDVRIEASTFDSADDIHKRAHSIYEDYSVPVSLVKAIDSPWLRSFLTSIAQDVDQFAYKLSPACLWPNFLIHASLPFDETLIYRSAEVGADLNALHAESAATIFQKIAEENKYHLTLYALYKGAELTPSILQCLCQQGCDHSLLAYYHFLGKRFALQNIDRVYFALICSQKFSTLLLLAKIANVLTHDLFIALQIAIQHKIELASFIIIQQLNERKLSEHQQEWLMALKDIATLQDIPTVIQLLELKNSPSIVSAHDLPSFCYHLPLQTQLLCRWIWSLWCEPQTEEKNLCLSLIPPENSDNLNKIDFFHALFELSIAQRNTRLSVTLLQIGLFDIKTIFSLLETAVVLKNLEASCLLILVTQTQLKEVYRENSTLRLYKFRKMMDAAHTVDPFVCYWLSCAEPKMLVATDSASHTLNLFERIKRNWLDEHEGVLICHARRANTVNTHPLYQRITLGCTTLFTLTAISLGGVTIIPTFLSLASMGLLIDRIAAGIHHTGRELDDVNLQYLASLFRYLAMSKAFGFQPILISAVVSQAVLALSSWLNTSDDTTAVLLSLLEQLAAWGPQFLTHLNHTQSHTQNTARENRITIHHHKRMPHKKHPLIIHEQSAAAFKKRLAMRAQAPMQLTSSRTRSSLHTPIHHHIHSPASTHASSTQHQTPLIPQYRNKAHTLSSPTPKSRSLKFSKDSHSLQPRSTHTHSSVRPRAQVATAEIHAEFRGTRAPIEVRARVNISVQRDGSILFDIRNAEINYQDPHFIVTRRSLDLNIMSVQRCATLSLSPQFSFTPGILRFYLAKHSLHITRKFDKASYENRLKKDTAQWVVVRLWLPKTENTRTSTIAGALGDCAHSQVGHVSIYIHTHHSHTSTYMSFWPNGEGDKLLQGVPGIFLASPDLDMSPDKDYERCAADKVFVLRGLDISAMLECCHSIRAQNPRWALLGGLCANTYSCSSVTHRVLKAGQIPTLNESSINDFIASPLSLLHMLEYAQRYQEKLSKQKLNFSDYRAWFHSLNHVEQMNWLQAYPEWAVAPSLHSILPKQDLKMSLHEISKDPSYQFIFFMLSLLLGLCTCVYDHFILEKPLPSLTFITAILISLMIPKIVHNMFLTQNNISYFFAHPMDERKQLTNVTLESTSCPRQDGR